MGYTIEYQADKDLLFVQHNGELDNTVVVDIFNDISKLSAEHNCHRYLADLTKSVITEDIFGIYKTASILQTYGLTVADKMAVVIARDTADHYFFETAVRNRGWYNIRYFLEFQSAMDWLDSADP